MTERDILVAVLDLLDQFPDMQIDLLQPDRWTKTPDTFEQILNDALRHSEQIRECRAWLDLCEVGGEWTPYRTTYHFKHEAERWAGHWISRSSMLIAAKIDGLEIRQSRGDPTSAELKLKPGRPGEQ